MSEDLLQQMTSNIQRALLSVHVPIQPIINGAKNFGIQTEMLANSDIVLYFIDGHQDIHLRVIKSNGTIICALTCDLSYFAQNFFNLLFSLIATQGKKR